MILYDLHDNPMRSIRKASDIIAALPVKVGISCRDGAVKGGGRQGDGMAIRYRDFNFTYNKIEFCVYAVGLACKTKVNKQPLPGESGISCKYMPVWITA